MRVVRIYVYWSARYNEMRSRFLLIIFMIYGGAFVGLMSIKGDVQGMTRDRERLLEEQIALKEERRVLLVEFAHLTSPERLKKIAATNGYVPIKMLDYYPLNPLQGSGNAQYN